MRIFIILFIFITACVALTPKGKEIPVFYLEKTECYGECPVFKLEIYDTGKMIFYGIRNTKLMGTFCSELEYSARARLKEIFRSEKYFAMQDSYLSRAKDLPTTITSFYADGRNKRIMDYGNSPEGLKRLEKMLETIADTTSWKICR
jgi:hypothetical protein